mgnify:CR=1 FL=1
MGQPLVIFKGYESSYNLHITDSAEENFYYSPFLKLPSQLSKKDKDSLQLAARDVVSNEVIPAFKSVKEFFETTYYPNTRKTIGVSEIPNGSDVLFYESAPRWRIPSTERRGQPE